MRRPTVNGLVTLLLLCGSAHALDSPVREERVAPSPGEDHASARQRPATGRTPTPRDSFIDSIEVRLTPLVVRVVTRRGQPIVGLDAGDFSVRAGGEELEIEAVDWVGRDGERISLPEPEAEAPPGAATGRTSLARPVREPGEPGRLVVFFYQTSLQFARLKGHVLMRRQARALLDSLPDRDLVAVLAFDSRLRILQDFTLDRERIAAVCDRAAVRQQDEGEPSSVYPSLGDALRGQDPSRAATSEQALAVLGRALATFPGEKAIVFLGWGLGGGGSDRPGVGNDLALAVSQLQEARASVFVLDITEADFHTLEAGLKRVARATGGIYEKTFPTSGMAIERMRGLLSGYYVLYVETTDLPPGTRRLEVEIDHVDGVVFTRPAIIR